MTAAMSALAKRHRETQGSAGQQCDAENRCATELEEITAVRRRNAEHRGLLVRTDSVVADQAGQSVAPTRYDRGVETIDRTQLAANLVVVEVMVVHEGVLSGEACVFRP